ncbi:hypothetical protein A1354_19120 [Pseudomonas asplenii]|nr:Ig-like domain-containing protein [Pseudomonas asplenii]PNG44055.1 hypothetical protein A1354_19120 [Pseudomonas asplenii]
MHEPVIQANQSLVLNGDFTQQLDHWTDKGAVGLTSEMYEGAFISFLVAGVGGSVTQQVSVPKKPDAGASYELTFLCEFRPGPDWSGQLGRLRILNGNTELMSIELKRETLRSLEDDTARLAAAQPLDFNPIAYRESLDHLAFDSGDTLTFEVSGVPSNPSDKRSVVRITRIDLQLKLEPLKLQALSLDEETLTPGQTLYLCLGASLGGASDDPLFMPHKLSFTPVAGSAWLDTQIALTSHGNPMEAVKADPEWGVDQALLSQWSLDCPAIGEEKSYDFSINLVNQYSAEPYAIDVSLGHHRLAIREVQDAAYYPVLEYAQSVRLGVQVVSFYTGQALDGRTVTWTASGQGVLGAGITDEQGWVYFDFAPSTAGDVVIKAAVESPYYASGEVTHEFAVKVLATDPWKALRSVVEEIETQWDVTGYPNRGAAHPVIVRLLDDSPLQGTDLSLHWSGVGHEQLGVTVRPPLEEPVPFDGRDSLWTLTSEDRLDGRFDLSLVCSKLLLPSVAKPMSLARNRIKVGEVREANKYPIVDEAESVLLRVQAVHEVARGDGDPVSNALVEWVIPDGDPVHSATGSGGWASLLYTPKTAGEKTITARLKAHPEAMSVEHPFTVTAVATNPWKSQVKIWLDDAEVQRNTLGVLCRRGQTHTLRVEPVAGSDWLGRNISLHWRGVDPDIGLRPTDLGTPKPLTLPGPQWQLVSDSSTSLSSLFELELHLEGETNVRELAGRLMSADLTEEVALMLDQVPSALDDRSLYPCLGAVHRFNVLPQALSPLVGLEASLIWSGTPADSLGATVAPPLEHTQTLNDGGAIWTLDFTGSETQGEFALTLALPQLSFEAIAKPMTLAHNKVRFEAWRESAVDPVIGQAPAWMWVQVYSHYTNRPVDQAPVSWIIDDNPRDIQTTTDGWSGFDFRPQVAGEESVTAAVLSRYDDYEDRRPMTVKSLASDPWEGLMVSFDKQSEQPMGQQTFFPRRKGQHELHVRALDGSDLLGQYLTLGMTESGPAALGIRFEEPRLGDPRLFSSAGLTYRFRVDDLKDGSFGLHCSSTRLASLSPVNAMSLGQGEQVVKIAERQRVNQTLFWGDAVTEQITVISSISGKPMVGVTVTWRSPDLGEVTSITNFYGVAKIEFVPTTPGALELTVSVGGALHSDSIALPFFVHEPREIQSLISSDPTGYPGQEVSAQVIVVSARTGEPLVDVDVEWEYPGIKIAPTKTDGTGKAEVAFRLPPIKEGWLLAAVKGGYAGWEVRSMMFTAIANSDTWLQEFTLWLNGEEVSLVDGKLLLSHATAYDLELRVRPHSWLIPWAEVALEDSSGAQALGLTFDPDLETLRPVDGEPIRWSVNNEGPWRNGDFTLKLTSPSIPDRLLPGQLFDIEAELDMQFDSFAKVFGHDTLYPCHRVAHVIRLRAKSGSSLTGAYVRLGWQGESAESLGLSITPDLAQEHQLGQDWLFWTLDCRESTRDGAFALTLKTRNDQWLIPPAAMRLAHNWVDAERWREDIQMGNGEIMTQNFIRATSKLEKELAPGVRVSVHHSDSSETYYVTTDLAGEAFVNTYRGVTAELKIYNHYDGSTV